MWGGISHSHACANAVKYDFFIQRQAAMRLLMPAPISKGERTLLVRRVQEAHLREVCTRTNKKVPKCRAGAHATNLSYESR